MIHSAPPDEALRAEAMLEVVSRAPSWLVVQGGECRPDVVDGPRALRELGRSAAPLVVLVANERERERLVRELPDHITTVLRQPAPKAEPTTVEVRELRLDSDQQRVFISDREIHLTRRQFKLLVVLVRRRERVQTRRALLRDVWEKADTDRSLRMVDVQVSRLREKLGPGRRYIQSVRGVGYRFSESPI